MITGGSSTEGAGQPVAASEKSARAFGDNVIFDVSQGLTVSAIEYCRKISDRGAFSKLNVTFGFDKTTRSIVVGGSSTPNQQYVCKKVTVEKNNCFTKVGAVGTESLQRLSLSTKQGASILAGFDFNDMRAWGSFGLENGPCMTGLHGASYGGNIIAIGFYFNSEVLPDGRLYKVATRKVVDVPNKRDPGSGAGLVPSRPSETVVQQQDQNATVIALIVVIIVLVICFGGYAWIKASQSPQNNRVEVQLPDDISSTDQELGATGKQRIIVPEGVNTDVSGVNLVQDTSQGNITQTRDGTPNGKAMKPSGINKSKFDTKKGRRNDKLALRDMLRQVNLHTKYYGNFIKNGVDTIDEFIALDKQHLEELKIEKQDLDTINN